MKENEILEEIHRLRAEPARECGYDVHKLFEELRAGTERLKAQGWKVAAPGPREAAEAPCALREEAPGGEK